jgi:transcriptional regulator with XRE-family HTH domain
MLLKRWRLNEDISQAMAAERLGVSQGLYSGWESGAKTPVIANLGKIRMIARISLEAWLPEDLRLTEPSPTVTTPKTRGARRPAAA